MSETKWTQGPWVVSHSADKRTGMRIRTATPVIEGARDGMSICRIDFAAGLAEGRANAHLITAAPEMYEAETLGRALWEALADQWSRLTAAQQCAAQAYFKANRSALAKADGKVAP